jgi:hypothetical protein
MTITKQINTRDLPPAVAQWLQEVDFGIGDLMQMHGAQYDRSVYEVLPANEHGEGWNEETVVEIYERSKGDALYGLESWMWFLPPIPENECL